MWFETKVECVARLLYFALSRTKEDSICYWYVGTVTITAENLWHVRGTGVGLDYEQERNVCFVNPESAAN